MLRVRLAFFTICSLLSGFTGCSSDDSASSSIGGDSAPDVAVEAGTDAPDASRVCEAGKQTSCACVGGGEGAQRCLDDGSGWGPCECPDSGQPDATPDGPVDAKEDVADDVAFDAAADATEDGSDAADDVLDFDSYPDVPEPDVIEEPECSAPHQCPGTDTACSYRTCDIGKCGIGYQLPGTQVDMVSECEWTICDGAGNEEPRYELYGTEVPSQTSGDCVTAICDGYGGFTSKPDLADLPPDDGNECTQETCSDHGPVTEPLTGTYCNSSCWCDPCGGTNPTEDDFSCDWGLCNNGTCVDSIPVNCAGSGWSYHGCHSAQPASYWISWGDTPETRCMGNTDVGYCAPGTACTVYHDTLGILYGTCQ